MMSNRIIALDLDAEIRSKMSNVGRGQWMCLLCNYVSTKSTNTYNHIEVYHMTEGMIYNCDTCNKSFKTKNSLNVHKSKLHKQQRQTPSHYSQHHPLSYE